jgi:ubiquinone/menaquinone biosynthesis C-methylase UbiE
MKRLLPSALFFMCCIALFMAIMPSADLFAQDEDPHEPHEDMNAEEYEQFVQERLAGTFPLTAMRMLGENGGLRKGVCIDIGCGPGHLDVELARRSEFEIIGLDIEPDMGPLFEERMREADLSERVSFVEGDAQELPFPDDYADFIVSRGTMIFIPDLGKCLREVDRVLKPTGVAMLGGRYLYAPHENLMTIEELREKVAESGVERATVVDQRGQWVKILGPDAPEAAQTFQAGPHMLAGRILAEYRIYEGRALVPCRGAADLEGTLVQGLLDLSTLKLTLLFPDEEKAAEARQRLEDDSALADRVDVCAGTIEDLPCDAGAFNLIAGVGPVFIWTDRPAAMREMHRVLKPGGAAFLGGRYLGMPDFRKVASDTIREEAEATGLPGIRVSDDMGQWLEIRKPGKDSE